MTGIPSAAQKLEVKAREAGWTVRCSLRVDVKVDTLLRFARDDEQLEARWTDGKFSGAWQAVPIPSAEDGGGVSPHRIGARELSLAIARDPAADAVGAATRRAHAVTPAASAALTDDEKRSLLILVMEDIRGWFDTEAGARTQAVLDLATELGYEQVCAHAQAYRDDAYYRDGRHFRTDWKYGGYGDPPFPVTRLRSEASPALIEAVEALCMTPEYRLEETDANADSGSPS